jgi:GH15 family glucan-1,4-alpha-glucosidase
VVGDRDASFTMFTLLWLGYTAEATAFMRWIEDLCRESESGVSLQVMHRIGSGHDLSETCLDHWEGYRGLHPVRVGNGACHQTQHDIFGELLDAVYIDNHALEQVLRAAHDGFGQ